jgi:hypothetical protein
LYFIFEQNEEDSPAFLISDNLLGDAGTGHLMPKFIRGEVKMDGKAERIQA